MVSKTRRAPTPCSTMSNIFQVSCLPARSQHMLLPSCSLTCRTFDAALAECCHLENVAFLAYSPLAMGILTVRAS